MLLRLTLNRQKCSIWLEVMSVNLLAILETPCDFFFLGRGGIEILIYKSLTSLIWKGFMTYYLEYMLLVRKLQNQQEKYRIPCSMQKRKIN